MSSLFDVDSFLDATTTEAGQKRELLSPGIDYFAEISDVKARPVQGKKDPTASYLFCDMLLVINLLEHPEEHSRVGIDKLTLRHSCSVDMTSSGAIDWGKGKNNGLRIMREATGTNVAGEKWSPRSLQGRRVRVRIKHREYPEGSGNLVEDVAAIAKA